MHQKSLPTTLTKPCMSKPYGSDLTLSSATTPALIENRSGFSGKEKCICNHSYILGTMIVVLHNLCTCKALVANVRNEMKHHSNYLSDQKTDQPRLCTFFYLMAMYQGLLEFSGSS